MVLRLATAVNESGKAQKRLILIRTVGNEGDNVALGNA